MIIFATVTALIVITVFCFIVLVEKPAEVFLFPTVVTLTIIILGIEAGWGPREGPQPERQELIVQDFTNLFYAQDTYLYLDRIQAGILEAEETMGRTLSQQQYDRLVVSLLSIVWDDEYTHEDKERSLTARIHKAVSEAERTPKR